MAEKRSIKLVLILSALFGGWTLAGASGCFRRPSEPVMAPCLILGDSIASGVGRVAPECATWAVSGLRSVDFAERFKRPFVAALFAALSLGTNDALAGPEIDTLGTLRIIRKRVHAPKVIWLMPVAAREVERSAVRTVASENGDDIMDISVEVAAGVDGIHPTSVGYRRIATRLLPQETAPKPPSFGRPMPALKP